jgi:hypothetical protein
MIKTGDWSIADLIKYLVAVQSTLSEDEIQRLKLTAAFPKESSITDVKLADGKALADANFAGSEGKKSERYRADQLYEPVDMFRKLGLPIIDWGAQNKWKPGSEEGSHHTAASLSHLLTTIYSQVPF